MTQVTGGTIKFERKKNLGDYNSKGASVELTFLTEEGKVPDLDGICELAIAKAERMLLDVRPKAEVQAPKEAAPTSTGNPRGRPKHPPAIVEPPVQQIPDNAAVVEEPTPNPTPAAVVEEPTAKESPPVTADPAAITEEDDLTSGVVEINDAKLNAELQHVNGRIKNAVAIRSLVGEFVGPPPKRVYDIPQARRQEFLDRLHKL